MLQSAPNCTIPKNFLGEACPLANVWLRDMWQVGSQYATRPAPQNANLPKSWMYPLANPARNPGLLLRNLIKEMRS